MMSRLFNTVRYLKPVQVYSRVFHVRPHVHSCIAPKQRDSVGTWRLGITRKSPRIGPRAFRFLNQDHSIETWNDAGIPKLWLYNLHYFHSPASDMIRSWIGENPVGQGNGWEPYPTSLRICNWIKWHLSGNLLEQAALESLAAQASYLTQAVEYHLLANHLFANAKALIFAGTFFEGHAAQKWRAAGLRILDTQMSEQVQADGGHFECSPMYHGLILEDVLDLINLSRTYPDLIPEYEGVARRMLGWLMKMTHPDGEIAFFNDAAFEVAPTFQELAGYANRLGIEPPDHWLPESGYLRLENDVAVVLFDASPIGPDYQPGHAHADTLSFELSVSGRCAIVNSGISAYENNAERCEQRGTRAHNTIRIDGENSSEVWSAFRVARRARPIDVTTDHRNFAEAGHDGYKRLKDPIVHLRRLDLQNDQLTITDSLKGVGKHEIEIYFHLHPESRIKIQMDSKLVCATERTLWYPEFNNPIPNETIVGRWTGNCPIQFITQIPLVNR